MILQPANLKELSKALSYAHALGEKIDRADLAALNRVLAHTPEDMTATVEAGLPFAILQAELTGRGQWLPIDPPHPDQLTIGSLIATNASGPRRFGYGTIRDYLIGIKVALANGRVIKSGGKVVKNVAGYDLLKLFVGSRGSLGVIVEATFKLRPLPEAERFVRARFDSFETAGSSIESVFQSELTPIVLDWHHADGQTPVKAGRLATFLVAGFAGTGEEVEWQLAKARDLGFGEPANLDYEKNFWAGESPPHRLSVLPSRLLEAVGGLGGAPFVARAGNGVIYYRDGAAPSKAGLPLELMRRVKDEFDAKHILPGIPA